MKSWFQDKNLDSQTLLNHIVLDFMREQRRKRITRWLMRILYLCLALVLYAKFVGFADDEDEGKKPHVGLIDVKGSIFEGQSGGADYLVKGLEDAYKKSGLKALIVRINSPGGSAVQADYMFSSINHYRKLHPKVKIYAVCVDICASAAYYIASATDEIYANGSSMVGSIGVLFNGFGFVDAMQKLGITRRLQTAGSYKGFLDPFSPTDPTQEKLLQTMLNEVHSQFIARVKEGRGKRLMIDDQTFSGMIWTGTEAKTRGLIDGFASSGELARDIIKIDSVIDYTHKESVLNQVSKSIGNAIFDLIPQALGGSPAIKAEW